METKFRWTVRPEAALVLCGLSRNRTSTNCQPCGGKL